MVETEFSGAQGTLVMMVGVDRSLRCTGISITQHSETSGLGANAASTAEVGDSWSYQNYLFLHDMIFDVSSAYKLSAVLGDNTFAATGPDWAYIWENTYHPRLGRVDMLLTGFLKQGAGYARFEERHSQRAYTEAELRSALQSCGFRDIRVYEAFTRDEPSPTAERLQFIARKE